MCDECKGTGYVGDNGAGIKGNREYEPCGCKNLTKSIEAKINNEWKERFNNLIGCIELSINQQFDSTPIERFIEENFTPKEEHFEIIELEDGKSRPEDKTTKEYWRKILRRRYDPVIAFNISEHNQNIRTLKETAKEEGCLTTYRATEGYLEGLLVVVFSGFSERKQIKGVKYEPI